MSEAISIIEEYRAKAVDAEQRAQLYATLLLALIHKQGDNPVKLSNRDVTRVSDMVMNIQQQKSGWKFTIKETEDE